MVWVAAQQCQAHFLWIKTITQDSNPQAFLFFGENALDEAYHLPESLADTKVFHRAAGADRGERAELAVKPWEGEDRIGLTARLAGDGACVLQASEQYGVYGTALLTYWAKHVRASSREQFNSAGASTALKLDIVPRVEGEELELTVLWDGKPLGGAKVTVTVADGESVEKTVDDDGRATLRPEGRGIVGVLANRTTDESGKLGDKSYSQAMHYSSLTFDWPVENTAEFGKAASARPPTALPEPLSSFGAVVVDGWLYVYGGHIGTEHDHSAANLSKHFRRIRVDGGTMWEELPMQTPLQGLPLVAHGGKVYRIGGLNARNATIDEEEDLHSTAEFAEFDPAIGTWESLSPLPAARSSHNAVVIGNRLYVVGGWTLAGSPPGDWTQDVVVFDFADPRSGWQEIETPPFKRRALAASHWDGKLFVLGGIDTEGNVTQRVDVFDPQSTTWSAGPDLPGEGIAGFGVSAWSLDGRLYASGMQGIVWRLNAGGSAWEEAAHMSRKRFFHQLVPAARGGLLAVGGASHEGHIADIEWIDVRN
jgi:hypothetical protein